MVSRAEIAEWLAHWSAHNHGGALVLSAADTCSFVVEQMPMQLTWKQEQQALLLAALPLDEDIGGEAATLRALLEWCHLGERSARIAASLASSGRPVLWWWSSGEALDGNQLFNALTNFTITAQNARELLIATRGAAPRPEHAPSFSATQPPTFPGLIRA